MAEIRIEDFGGTIPRRSARLLPPNFAQVARDCKLFSGELRGWNTPLFIEELNTPPDVKTVFRIPSEPTDIWLTSQYENVHIQKGTLVNDAHERYYWTEPESPSGLAQYNTAARIDNGDPSFILGAPPPTVAPSMASPSTGSGQTVTRAFVYTFVSAFGEESAPSPVTTKSGKSDASDWSLTNLQVESDIPDNSSRNFSGGTKNIYRTITAQSGQTNFYFIKTIPINDVSVNVSESDEVVAYNALLESTNWNEPPDNLEGIVTHPNGFLVGYVGRDLYFSEPYRPHAFPARFVLSCDSEIMGLGIVGNTIGVTTQANPYGCTGVSPSAMSLTKSTTVEPCLSKAGVVTLPNGVYYPSNNGLAWLNPVGASVVTRPVMTKEEWQRDFSPSTLTACRYGTRYMAFLSETEGFIFDPEEPRSAVVNITHTGGLTTVYTDIYSGLVHILADSKVFEWDPSANTIPVVYTWRSKVFEFTKPLNLGAGILKFRDKEFLTDPDYLAVLEAINAAIFPTNPLAPLNSMSLNGVRKAGDGSDLSYVSDLHNASAFQSGALNDSDLIPTTGFTSFVAEALVAVIADNREVFRSVVKKDTMFRLPSGYKAHTYEIEIVSNTDVFSIAIAETAKGLMRA